MKMEKMERSWRWTAFLIGLYLGAIVTANWLVTKFGQSALPFTAFLLIPFDLVIRDLMQDRWQGRKSIALRMAALITVGGMISIATGTGGIRINVASFVAFTAAATLDALTYQTMIKYGRIARINGATALAALTDSIIFAFLAFDFISWPLVGAQFAMKVAGGFVWSLVMYRFFRPPSKPSRVIWGRVAHTALGPRQVSEQQAKQFLIVAEGPITELSHVAKIECLRCPGCGADAVPRGEKFCLNCDYFECTVNPPPTNDPVKEVGEWSDRGQFSEQPVHYVDGTTPADRKAMEERHV
ncbi:MAG: VUT family protein [Pyrinomonadaceae bacterium]